MPSFAQNESSPPALSADEQRAIAAVREACRIARAVADAPGGPSALAKADASPVTVADFAVQCWITHALAEAGEVLPIIGEETSAGLRSAGPAVLSAVHAALPASARPEDAAELPGWLSGASEAAGKEAWWLLDPIDGTKGFLRGGQYAICLALVRAGAPVFGILGCPALPSTGVAHPQGAQAGVLLIGRKGDGAWQCSLSGDAHWQRITCSEGTLGSRRLRVCESRDSSHGQHGLLDAALGRLDAVAEAIRIDSQCKYALVARGDAEVFVRLPRDASYAERAWDHAAGCVIATAAGARVSDLDGAPLDFSTGASMGGRGVLVASPDWHGELLAALRQIRAEEPR